MLSYVSELRLLGAVQLTGRAISQPQEIDHPEHDL